MDNSSSLYQEDGIIPLSRSVVFHIQKSGMENTGNSINNTSLDNNFNRPMIDTTYSIKKDRRNTI